MNQRNDKKTANEFNDENNQPEYNSTGEESSADELPGFRANHDNSSEPKERSSEYGEELVGKMIGPYKILQPLGHGGMGEVYLAEQNEPVRRRVALKLVKKNQESKQILARFEAERQALAMMNHENIAKVLDAGEHDGRPYFAMELVNGIAISRYCDLNKLSINDRLNLFVQVCNAVNHAHQKGILHRDLSPSNILVEEKDGTPIPKVIDFGLAKALNTQAKLTDKTYFTEFGRVVGKVHYMSPEQAEMNPLDVDTRTDIYSLGVILYELLTGTRPLDDDTVKQNAFLKLLELIREQEPPKPSSRVSDPSDASVEAGKRRNISQAKLRQTLDGDLDWIVMKSLEKDRARRYSGANEFGSDIKNYLNGDPITARKPTIGYRLSKFVKKNRLPVLITSVVAVLLLAGLVVSSVLSIQLAKSLKNEQEAQDKLSTSLNNEKKLRKNAEKQTQISNLLSDDLRVQKKRAEDSEKIAKNITKTQRKIIFTAGRLNGPLAIVESLEGTTAKNLPTLIRLHRRHPEDYGLGQLRILTTCSQRETL